MNGKEVTEGKEVLVALESRLAASEAANQQALIAVELKQIAFQEHLMASHQSLVASQQSLRDSLMESHDTLRKSLKCRMPILKELIVLKFSVQLFCIAFGISMAEVL